MKEGWIKDYRKEKIVTLGLCHPLYHRVWKTMLKEKVSSEDMISAAINYSRYCRDKGVDPQYINHPGTFLGPDKPFEEFIHRMPEIKRTVDIPKNVSNALELCQRVENGEIGEASLW